MNATGTLIYRFIAWMLDWRQFGVGLLLCVVVASSLGVIYAAHATRALYAELQELQGQEDRLDSEYEKLLLEQGAWANYSRMDQVSRNELNMSSPRPEDIVVVKR